MGKKHNAHKEYSTWSPVSGMSNIQPIMLSLKIFSPASHPINPSLTQAQKAAVGKEDM